MSVTTTANPIHYEVQSVLRDYDIQHSADEPLDTSLNAHPNPSPQTQNPSHWPVDHNRVPAYRPINTELDQSERRVYANGLEQAFIGVMFTGVYLQSAASKIWRGSVGRIWDVGYAKGGEW
ncbi:hypothetical protein P153DRAFT_394231 [Dothidotthia symphoricarpi CBS 119687]|uniref:Uncharacterized protein n=1 Tax=Dothidotthia symphoricarpi CBS 119687 TaxID=1392245 RepID=A0A6A6ALK1_9PLEO|nr:uncharacterized protein P153DRAFT_394231 [Dothidotthia symphoricarpi CBS 119687]KAF2132053.1 hypothetical protein P153DRAFT_394231 [Dothidotthia symphoricarpi CBS 119687]